jgi:hypothetical protein
MHQRKPHVENPLALGPIRWNQRQYIQVSNEKAAFLLSCLLGCLPGFIGLSSFAAAQTPVAGEWTWMGGSKTVPTVPGQLAGQPGVYGTLGTPAPGNTPGARTYPLGWTDNNGNLWLFGGLLGVCFLLHNLTT